MTERKMDCGLIYLSFSFSVFIVSISDWLTGIRKTVIGFLGLLCFLKFQYFLSASKKVLFQMESLMSQGGLR